MLTCRFEAFNSLNPSKDILICSHPAETSHETSDHVISELCCMCRRDKTRKQARDLEAVIEHDTLEILFTYHIALIVLYVDFCN